VKDIDTKRQHSKDRFLVRRLRFSLGSSANTHKNLGVFGVERSQIRRSDRDTCIGKDQEKTDPVLPAGKEAPK
jgi:hypothetical protein